MVSRRIWIEGSLLLVISVVSLFESLRLIIYKNPRIQFDPIGPGYYILLVSLGFLVTSLIYIRHHLKEAQPKAKEHTSREMRIRLFGSFATYAIYLILVDVTGYSAATFVFFILMFRIVGIRSWPSNVVLSAVLTFAYYIVFVKYCSMAFPTGILF